MNFLNRLSLTTRLTVVFVAIGTIPLVAMGLYAIKGLKSSDAIAIENLHSRAESAMDKIERNLFERYGDVQAFGLNAAVFNKADWHKPGAEANAVVRAANSYVQLYGIYALSLVVDTEGKVIAVNDKNAAGQPIDTKALYSRNFANETWFKKSMAGEFLKSDILNGTHVEDVNIDEDVKTITGGSGLNVGFAAPVKGLDGKIIGVWLNRADFSVVEEIIGAVYKDLLRSGRGTAEITALDRSGRVIIDYDPATRGGKLEFQHDTNVIFKLNLAENNVAAAKALIAGQSGAMESRHSRKGVDQAVGFAKSKGALGYPGLGWGIMIRVGTSEAYAASNRATLVLAVNLAAAIILIAVIAFRFGRSTARPMLDGIDNLRRLGEAVASSSTQVAAASQSIADSASQQAASLEETSASITELASMTARSKEQAQAAKNFSDQTKSTATAGNDDVKAMAEAMDQIRKAGEEVRLAIADIQASGTEVSRIVRTIDEIAFQTNILALNAAVEAARAGEAGLGFAVVADEVRNLAQRSARAAKETSELIDTSNRKSELGAQVSRRLDESLRAVEQSAKKVRVRFAEIAAQTTDVDKAMAEIAAATRDQADGLSQINKAVSSMDEITQSNAAGAEESAAAANELRTYAADVWHAVESMRAVVTGAVEAPPAVRANGAEPSPKQNVKKPAAPAPKPQHIFHRRTAEEPNLYSLESSARSESQTAQSQDDAFASLPMREIKGSADTKVRPRANPGDFRDF